MRRLGNCWDSAVTEIVFQLLKREQIRQIVDLARYVAREDAFDCVEML